MTILIVFFFGGSTYLRIWYIDWFDKRYPDLSIKKLWIQPDNDSKKVFFSLATQTRRRGWHVWGLSHNFQVAEVTVAKTRFFQVRNFPLFPLFSLSLFSLFSLCHHVWGLSSFISRKTRFFQARVFFDLSFFSFFSFFYPIISKSQKSQSQKLDFSR